MPPGRGADARWGTAAGVSCKSSGSACLPQRRWRRRSRLVAQPQVGLLLRLLGLLLLGLLLPAAGRPAFCCDRGAQCSECQAAQEQGAQREHHTSAAAAGGNGGCTPLQLYQQCGGMGNACGSSCADAAFPGTCCQAGSSCERKDAWYWQCVLPAPPPPPAPKARAAATLPVPAPAQVQRAATGASWVHAFLWHRRTCCAGPHSCAAGPLMPAADMPHCCPPPQGQVLGAPRCSSTSSAAEWAAAAAAAAQMPPSPAPAARQAAAAGGKTPGTGSASRRSRRRRRPHMQPRPWRLCRRRSSALRRVQQQVRQQAPALPWCLRQLHSCRRSWPTQQALLQPAANMPPLLPPLALCRWQRQLLPAASVPAVRRQRRAVREQLRGRRLPGHLLLGWQCVPKERRLVLAVRPATAVAGGRAACRHPCARCDRCGA
jgi:hypothetical protein